MKKRIRLHQVRVGMFVEELESSVGGRDMHPGAFLVSTPADVERILGSRALSLVINTRKGCDSDPIHLPVQVVDRARLERGLLESYSAEELAVAKRVLHTTAPYIRGLLNEARMNGVFAADAAKVATRQILDCANRNTGALIGLLRLKQADELSFLHCIGVSALMIAFARRLGLGSSEVYNLGYAGLVHDVGKMLLPPAILSKSGPLSEQETAIVRQHPQKGYDLLRSVPDIHPTVLEVCLYHHERFDGKGYPFGLSGDAIPFVARLAAICDVFEAMTTVRPYKKAWSRDDTIGMMLSSHGHFDPALLNSFVSSMIVSGTIQ